MVRKGYKQTEVGEIPEDWDIARFAEFGESFTGLTYTPSDVSEYGTLVLRSSNIQNGRLSFENNVFVRMNIPTRVIVQEGDILICVRNGSRQLIGKCALIDKTTEGAAFGAFMSIFRSQHGKFSFYQFQSRAVQRQIEENMGATINQITNKDMASFVLPVPSCVLERNLIANTLSDCDSLIISLEALIAKKRDMKTATMQQLLTGKMRLPGFCKGKGYKQTELGEIPEDWLELTLGQIGNFKKGKGIKKDQVLDSGLPCIRYGEIYTRHSDYIREFCSFISEEIASESTLISEGDLLFAGSGETAEEIGKCVAYLGAEPAYAGGDIVILSPSGHCSRYLGYLMNHSSIVSQKSRMGQGDAVVHIHAPNLSKIKMCLPELPEQKEIANTIANIDTEILAIEKELNKVKFIKRGMMQELLTGRTRLVDAPAVEEVVERMHGT